MEKQFWFFSETGHFVQKMNSFSFADLDNGNKSDMPEFSTNFDIDENKFNDFLDIQPINEINGVVISSKTQKILDQYNIQTPYYAHSSILSNGVEEKECFLFYLKGDSLEQIEHIINFEKSVFYIGDKRSKKRYEKIEEKILNVESLNIIRLGIQEKRKSGIYGEGARPVLLIKKLSFKVNLDFMHFPFPVGRVISNRLKEALIQNGITGWRANSPFREYIIEMPQEETS